MTEPAREPSDHFVSMHLRDLTLNIEYDGIDDIALDETLDTLLQSTIDAATAKPSDLPGLIVLRASLRRWSAHARRAIKRLEREMTRPGYLDDGEA